MINFYNSIENAADIIAFWGLIVSIGSFIVTTVLTIYIIRQTTRLNKRQQNLERMINQSQIEMQQRQLKLDVYEYRREVYLGLTKIFNLCSSIKRLMDELKIDAFEPDEFVLILENEMSENVGDGSDIVYSLKESKHLFNAEIFNRIKIVDENFKAILSCITILNFQKGNGDYKFSENITKSGICYIKTICNEKEELIELLDKELDVSNLEK